MQRCSRALVSRLILPIQTLILSASLLALSACPGNAGSDASGTPGDSKGEEKTSAGDASGGDEGLAELDLDSRPFPLLVWAVYIISKDYYDPGRFAPKAQLGAAADALGLHTPEFFGTVEGDALEVRVGAASKTFDLAGVKDVRAAGDVLEQVLVFTRAQLDLEDEPLHELEYAAVNGFLSPLDPHTILLTPEQHADLGVKTRGHFGGIGAEIVASDRRILVARVLPKSPAELAGLMDGDLIVKIDEQSTVNMSSGDAQGLLRGPVGTKVVVKVIRDGDTVEITITRDTISIPSVEWALLPDRVGYVSISAFQEDTSAKVEEALADLAEQAKKASPEGGDLAAVLFDLRGNSGGLLTQATGILDQLVTAGELVIVHSASGREHEDATDKLVLPEGVPVVALINEDSASAAEIVSGSIKHLGRGIVIGQDSFGKGTVQRLSAARPYGRELALKLTVAEYRVAGDRKINSVGVHTDVSLVPVQFSEIEGIARYYDDERFERARQRYRTAHLPSARHESQADTFVSGKRPELRYLDTPPDPPKVGEQLSEADSRMEDPEIRIARELALTLVGEKGRDAQLARLTEPVKKIAAEQDAAIVARAKEQKLEWGAADASASTDAKLKVEAKLAIDGPVPAGKPFELRVAVTNEGDAVAERVHLITDCAQDELDGIELLIGNVDPGATVERQIELYLMPWHSSLEDRLVIEAHAAVPDAKPDGRAEVMFSLKGAERPRYAFDYWIVDDPALVKASPKRPKARFPSDEPFEVTGNGDGVLQPGEHVLFAFEVRNDGEGASTDTRAIIRNLSGTQGLLEEGLYEVGPLPPGKSARGAFGIDVSEKADPAQPLELDVLVGDGQLRESVNEKLRLRVAASKETFEALDDVAKVGEEPARLYAGAHASTGVVMEVPPGTGLKVLGKTAGWFAVAGPEGRRVWVPSDLVTLGEKGAKVPPRSTLMIDPPRIEVGKIPSRVNAEKVTITGTITHPDQVRDVMIVVYPSDPAKPTRKAHYAANPAFDPSGAEVKTGDPNMTGKSFLFSAQVSLAPGSNRISIVARDADKVERRKDVWVYLDLG